MTDNSPKKSFGSIVASVSCKPSRPVLEICTRPRPTSISVDPGAPSSKIWSPACYSVSRISTERSSSCPKPSKSRFVRNTPFMVGHINSDDSTLQHRTFLLQCSLRVQRSCLRERRRWVGHTTRAQTSFQTAAEFRHVECFPAIAVLCDCGESPHPRFSRSRLSNRIGQPCQNRPGNRSAHSIARLRQEILFP